MVVRCGAGASTCWCAAAGVLCSVVRCRRGSRPAGALPRPALGWSPQGPRPGGWRRRWSGVSGCDPRRTPGSAFMRGTPRLLRFLRDPVTNAEAFDLRRANEESWVPFALGGREILPSREPFHAKGESPPRPGRHRWICNRRSVSAVADPPIGRANAEPWPQNAEEKDRASKGELGPGPETRNQPQARCRSRPFRRPAPANGEAAQRQGQTPCGTAPAGPRPRRHRTSKVTTPAGSARPRPRSRPRVGRMKLRPGRSGDRPGGGAGCGGRR
ncbi:hypothetical protein QE370_002427 [Aeromicrobium sp. SORGH_AS981]|nr:hypothetical protein [Aeromicrobium sp. SORGH_AS_0981]